MNIRSGENSALDLCSKESKEAILFPMNVTADNEDSSTSPASDLDRPHVARQLVSFSVGA